MSGEAELAVNQGSHPFIGKQFKQHRMLHATIDNMRGLDTRLHGIQRTTNLGQHAAVNGAVGDQCVNFAGTPEVFVSNISFSARNTSDIFPATKSALIL